MSKESKYKANFLYPYEEDSLESLLYEFVNCKTEEYREGIYLEIKEFKLNEIKGK